MRRPPVVVPKRKFAEFFRGLYSFGSGALQNGFFPVVAGGQSAPPINAATSESGELITQEMALSLSAVWACVWLIADTISTLPFLLYERSGAGKRYGSLSTNSLASVLGVMPNQDMSACEFWQFIVASELLWGNGYAQIYRNKAGDVTKLDPLRPEFMVPYRDPDSRQMRYKYQDPLGVQDFAQSDIFHLKDRTLDGLVGVSRIQFARNSLGIAKSADRATSETFKNGMRSGGFLTSDKLLKPDAREALRTSLSEFKTGGQNSASLMVLEAGLDFTPLTMSPQDVQLLLSRQFAIEDICRWFGVPPVLIGHAAQGVTSWGSGIEQLLIGWLSLNLRPYVRKIEQTVLRSLLTAIQRPMLYLSIDTDDLLGADSAARAALYSNYAQNGIMTRNEIRAKEDLAPQAGGDELTVQSNLIPIGKLGELGGQPTVPEPPKKGKAGELMYAH